MAYSTFRSRFFGFFLFAIAFSVICADRTANAQDVLRIAAVVNDRVISGLDVVNRLKFVIWSTGVPNTPENRKRLSTQILRNLIDEELQSQEADKLNVSVNDRDVENALATVAKRNKMTARRLTNILLRNGISASTLRRQLRVQIAWGRAIGRRLRRDVRVTDEEVDAEIERIEALRNKPRFRVSEIFLSVDDPDQDKKVRQAALRLLKQIADGADFSAIASAFSQSTSAAQGGDIGWIQPGRLSRELDNALSELKPKQVSQPIRTLSGYYLLLLRDVRQPEGSQASDAVVDLHQIVLPDTGNSDPGAQKALAEDIRSAITGCADLPGLIKQIGTTGSGPLGKLKLSDLSPTFRDAVVALKAGESSAPIVSPAGRMMLLTVCDRVEPKKKPIRRSAVRKILQQRRAELVARRYLRDLRRTAFVDLRG